MRAFHIISIDFEFGLGVRCRRPVEQHRLHRLCGVSLLRIACDRDLAEIGTGRMPAKDRAHHLVAGRIGLSMRNGRDNLQHLFAGAEDDSAQFEMCAVVKGDVQFYPPVIAP